MSIPGSASPLFFQTAADDAAAAFQIDRSIRLNSGDSAYLNRTPSSAGNRKTWTWSGWVKRTALGADNFIFSAGSDASNMHYLRFKSNDTLEATEKVGDSVQSSLVTSAVFRDPSAWMHIIYIYDSSQATAADRLSLIVNGSEITAFSTSTYPSQNHDSYINSTSNHFINARPNPAGYSDFYLTEIQLLDGTAVSDASDFGEYDSNNVWQPIDTSSLTFGTNGFRLKFDDNSSNSALGSDSSGADNDWTVNNISAIGSAWNQSQTWSSSLSSSTGFRGSEPATNAFDGDTTSICSAVNDGVVTFTSPVTFASSSTIRVIVHGGDHTVTVNGGSDQTISAGSYQTVTFTNSSNSTFTMTFQRDSSADTGIRAIEIGGNVLVDSSVVDPDAEEIDSLIDTPTNYTSASGNNGGCYATLNPLDFSSSGSPALSNGNLDAQAGSGWQSIAATIGNLTSGKWYWEVKLGGGSGHRTGLSSVARSDASSSQLLGSGDIALNSSDGRVYVDGTEVGTGVGSLSGKTVGIALNLDANSVSFYQNNSLVHTVSSLSSTASWTPVHATRYAVLDHLNFGQRSFAYTPPTDHLSVCTQNLPDPTIADGSTAMNVKTWSGDNTERAITGYNHSPDFVWIKTRSSNYEHVLSDIVRGAGKVMSSSANNKEADFADPGYWGYVKSFDSDGFTVDDGAGGYRRVNLSGETYCGWAWDAGSSTASNTDGTITSSVRASQTNGFSIVSYTSNDTAGATVGHGLNAAMEFAIFKNRDASINWVVYHKSLDITSGQAINLNQTGAAYTSNAQFNSTAATSSVFTIGSGGNTGYESGDNFIAYCWTSVSQYSSFGSYEGNGSASGPFVYTGMRPRFILVKNVDAADDWCIADTTRSTHNVQDETLFPNSPTAEDTGFNIDILSNGFRPRNTTGKWNSSGKTYIYAAFAEHPQKTARAR